MKFVKRHALMSLILFVLAGVLAGLLCARFFYHRAVEKWYQEGLIGAPSEVGDSALGFVLVWGSVGLFVGLAIGIVVYVTVKRNDGESSLDLNLTNKTASE